MIELKDGDTFVVVHNDDSRVDFIRDNPGYKGTIVYDYTDVGGLYYNNYYDYPLDGIGKILECIVAPVLMPTLTPNSYTFTEKSSTKLYQEVGPLISSICVCSIYNRGSVTSAEAFRAVWYMMLYWVSCEPFGALCEAAGEAGAPSLTSTFPLTFQ